MASGAWEWGGANSWSAGRLEFSSSSNGSSANSSNVTVRLYARRVDGGTSYNQNSNGNQFWVRIDGTTYNGSGACTVSGSGWQLVCSATKAVGHNGDGSKQINIAGGGSINGTSFNMNSHSVNVNLDKIPRYASITTWKSTAQTQTSVTFQWGSGDTCDSVQYKIGSGSWVGTSGNTFTVSGLSPGTSYTFYLQIRRKDSGLWTASSGLSVTTVPIASIKNGNGFQFNIGSPVPLTFENYDKNASYLKLCALKSDGTWNNSVLSVNIPVNTASYSLATSSASAVLYSYCPNSNDLAVKIIMGVTINGISHENIYTGTAHVTGSNPVFGTYSYSNTDTALNNVLQNTSYIIQNQGNMQAQISAANKAIAKNSASIIKYAATVKDSKNVVRISREASYSPSASVLIDFGTLGDAGTYTIDIYAIDSRSNISPTISKTFYILEYHKPITTITLTRAGGYGKEIAMTLSSIYSKLMIGSTQKNNSFTVKYRYKQVGTASWSSYTALSGFSSSSASTADTKVTLTKSPLVSLADTQAFNFEFLISDKVNSITQSYLVSEGIPIMIEGANGQVSVGMVPEWSNTAKLQVASDILATDSTGKRKLLLEEIKRINYDLSENLASLNINLQNSINELKGDITEFNNNMKTIIGNTKKIVSGTKVISSTGGTSAPLFTNAQINSLLGVTNSSNANTVCFISNGDGVAQSAHFDGSTYSNGTWYVTFNTKVSASTRVNYLIIRF